MTIASRGEAPVIETASGSPVAARFVYVTFIITIVLQGLDKLNLAPKKVVNLFPEMWAGVLYLVIAFWMFRFKRLPISGVYGFLFVVLLLEIILGIIANHVSSGTAIVGLRYYLKFFPLFLIPFMIQFSDKELSRQFSWICALMLIQVPISLYQRFVMGANLKTGDIVTGTFSSGGHQAIFSFSVAAVLVVLFIRKRIKGLPFLLLFLTLLVPNLFNETKSSLFFLVTAVFGAILLSQRLRFADAVKLTAVGAIFMAVFVTAYQAFFLQDSKRFDTTADAFSYDRLSSYVNRSDVEDEKVGKLAKVGLTIETISQSPITFVFGLGVGNTTESFLGDDFEGEYFQQYEFIKGGTVASLLFDVGFFGVLICILLAITLWRDSRFLARSDDAFGSLGHAWSVVLIIVFLACFYRSILTDNPIGYALTYFSGVVAAEAARRRLAVRRESRPNEYFHR